MQNLGPRPDYELHPSDVIDEEDLEESTGELSSLKKKAKSRIGSINQSLQSLKKLSPYINRSSIDVLNMKKPIEE